MECAIALGTSPALSFATRSIYTYARARCLRDCVPFCLINELVLLMLIEGRTKFYNTCLFSLLVLMPTPRHQPAVGPRACPIACVLSYQTAAIMHVHERIWQSVRHQVLKCLDGPIIVVATDEN
ncbi:hypothetical protein FIBSPDRAFT_67550 [Athelia psychrophila]|uniref:Uncharacterized protein n=1 Tax=Athelia psychrophila TaxID=1759441 RepID=A0A166EV27_9AGAM|nr:hypothetical protein FIBSPDRAFT_67550 [Fibularhizoctonia sp. CBS 109695]